METFSVILAKERERENNNLELPDSSATFTCSVAKRKLNQPPKVSKLTCSAIDKGVGVPDDTIERKCRAVAVSKLSKLHVQLPPHHNQLKRTHRSTLKLQMEVDIKDPSPPEPSIQEELSESRSPLNPLAARSALASIMSKMTQNLEVSIYHQLKLNYSCSSEYVTCKLDLVQSLNGTKSHNFSTGNVFYEINNLSLQPASASVPFDPDSNRDVKLLISTSCASEKAQTMETFSVILAKERERENNNLELPDSSATFTCSVAKRKLNQPPKVSKLTCSAIDKGAGVPDDTIERKACVEQKKFQSSIQEGLLV
ncbi:uncharacterized protein LOC130759847 [Actinidia eriantha]|uniref:uncharacterized protein LOC130759847 n=1 Tax=Actinidia eriantha TaxID=165200 RepID=UPI002585FD74|nr:uncharacterized protein LOC130759847 [Actinidia eriantha]XP_057471034.1 uncharacterized protein LOC130759847 [Actinidia eriantha]XP_057471035.1 uncharacterized protein LOC130759847 [Actinidia eriantha]XP_057471036.1 uncharacterized protein LOC130759847 [Actinidia eriantha]XP_057471037.1 uncharacterized protein LOC130759847 [Actinidia eriantha]XP_057471038.1 uncharacterized protein LOC130759847 [Actinidia eriantha]XP_057471039.1 uncharacterized protein LOC130759847 [Actinidia eriantha]XP_0